MQAQYSILALQKQATACIVLTDGSIFYGRGFGATGVISAELCFNTAMTGYQEIITDYSYAGQAIIFTFPHIGNTGITAEDDEATAPTVKAIIVKSHPSEASNWRAQMNLSTWLGNNGSIGVSGIDTRRLTRKIRKHGAPHAVISHNPDGRFDRAALLQQAQQFEGLSGKDLAGEVTCQQSYQWHAPRWCVSRGKNARPNKKIVAIDYGIKRNILRCLVSAGCDVIVLPAKTTAEEVLEHNPQGLFLSNGPADPVATGAYAIPMIRNILKASDLAIFGICLGHQMLALALGAKTIKMNHGHHGANHPVKELASGRVKITSMNHGFTVDRKTLPLGVEETHISLFDGSNCGIRLAGRAVFSVQYHPEASPGPHDSLYLFKRFVALMR